MPKFVPRLKTPDRTNKCYIHYDGGGYSICMKKDGNWVLENCVGWCHGRILENMGYTKPQWNVPAGDAKGWYADAQKKGFKVGQTPKFGAIICYNFQPYGHVASVEKIYDNGDIEVGDSHASGAPFEIKKLTKASGYAYNGNKAQGFIYLPTEFDGDIISTKPTTQSTPAPKNETIHTVVKGDTLWALAVKYLGNGSRWTEIQKLNGLTSTALSVGQKLRIPVAPSTKTLTDKSYPDYTDGLYTVRRAYSNVGSQVGAYRIWKNAYNKWLTVKANGYHVYDKKGNQLD